MNKIFVSLLLLLIITQASFANDCHQFFVEMTKSASGASKALANDSFKSSNAITEFKARANGPGPGVGAQQSYRVAIYNIEEKQNLIYKNFQNSINDEIQKHANCFSNKELQEITDQ